MIVETKKGSVSLSGATSVTVKRNPLAYVPKIIGLCVAIIGVIALLFLIGGAISERAHTPWYGWLIMAFFAVAILSGMIGGGMIMVADPGRETENDFRKEEDSYTNISFILALLGGLSLLLAFLAPPVEGIAPSSIASGFSCLALAAIIYWSKSLAGKLDATIAYPTHRTTIRAISPYDADQLTAAFRERQPAA
ncbi:hypothetical protein K7W03_25800 [Sphingobium sp. PNB]|uniref:hypothetical protein n=1 Tax=Sphingobium sp. PNB TaxID=863934 RepID=UPI001CA39992|nr:hypothetical protein [Sphingobium sp. PNB]MCB4863000.1 hypothetical protein [Sphingobium sp. PNB]